MVPRCGPQLAWTAGWFINHRQDTAHYKSARNHGRPLNFYLVRLFVLVVIVVSVVGCLVQNITIHEVGVRVRRDRDIRLAMHDRRDLPRGERGGAGTRFRPENRTHDGGRGRAEVGSRHTWEVSRPAE